MENKEKAEEFPRTWMYISIFLFSLAIISHKWVNEKEIPLTMKYIRYPKPPKTEMAVDINRDGLDDLVLANGEVKIKQVNGTYIPLAEIIQEEIDSTMTAIERKYSFKKEEVKNPFDNLDYRLNTGKYIIGSQK